MKKFFLFLVFSVAAMTISAQSESAPISAERVFQRPDYEQIQSIGKPAYEALVKRLYNADTTLTLKEKQDIYFGSAFYGYYAEDFDESKVREMMKARKSPKAISKYIDNYLKKCPADLRAILYRAYSAADENDKKAVSKYANIFAMLCDAIIRTGNGETERTAWHVVTVADEYTLMWYVFEVKVISQLLTSTKCDMITVATESGIQLDLYFDVQLVLAMENLALRKDESPFYFIYTEQTVDSEPIAGINYQKVETEKEDSTLLLNEDGGYLMDEDGNYIIAENMPRFPGGMDSLVNFLSTNVKYPKECVDANIQGKVMVQFVVDTDGSITDVEVVRSAGDPLLDKEAVRVVQMMPKWIPGTIKGRIVRVGYTLPINFKIPESSSKK